MVHRNDGFVPEAWVRAGRTLLQNLVSVAAVAVGPALVTASSGGNVDLAALGIAGGQAALAAALAYVHNVVRPAGGRALGETTWRAGRTFLQSIVAAAAVPGAAAIASTGGDDWKTLALAGGQAALAGVIALVHNVVSPRTGGGQEGSDGAGQAAGGQPVDATAGAPLESGNRDESAGDGYRQV